MNVILRSDTWFCLSHVCVTIFWPNTGIGFYLIKYRTDLIGSQAKFTYLIMYDLNKIGFREAIFYSVTKTKICSGVHILSKLSK